MRCLRKKRVRSKLGGTVMRCAKFSGGRRGKPRSRARYRRGKRPFNKGKTCVAMGRSRTGKPVCRSYGSRSGWRSKRGRGRYLPRAGMFTRRPAAAASRGIRWLGR